MVWQEKASSIVMLTKLQEGGKVKCEQYWPESDTQSFGPFHITITDHEILPDYTKHTLMVEVGNARLMDTLVCKSVFMHLPFFHVSCMAAQNILWRCPISNSWSGLTTVCQSMPCLFWKCISES